VQRPLLADAYAMAPGDDGKAARILRVSLGYGIWMPPQPLDVARKPPGGLQTSICLVGYGPLSNRQRHGLRDGSARPSKSDAGSASVPPATGGAKYSMRPC
jgi:hypothetical protein